ncbi:tetratricopeptide repeat protein [Nostoc piscinale]|uniref:tetratricopeptide repeat protein n=1 Tax=Nostoc piscinale TaxID=224012 RepID=UPI002FFCCD86
MTNFWRFLFSLLVVFSLTFASQFLFPSTSLAQIVPSESVDFGVLQMQQDNYEAAIVHFNQAIAQNRKKCCSL